MSKHTNKPKVMNDSASKPTDSGREHSSDLYVKHLELLQHAIERMSQNSFALKGWAMSLVVAICALSAAGSEHKFAVIAFVPLVVFWFLDAYFLQVERKYRALYNRVRCHEVLADLSMDIYGIKGPKTHYLCCLFSKTEIAFYGAIIVGIAILFVWLGVFAKGAV